MPTKKAYTSFKDFYLYYLREHANPINRALHFIGTTLLLISFIYGVVSGKAFYFALIPILGYGFAWVGHFFIEKNKPATFTYPFYSLASDFVMFWHILTGQINQQLKNAQITIAK
jgi:hypothetical protein